MNNLHLTNSYLTTHIIQALKNQFTDTIAFEHALTLLIEKNDYTKDILQKVKIEIQLVNHKKSKTQPIQITTSNDNLHVYNLTLTSGNSYKIVFMRTSKNTVLPVLYNNPFERLLNELIIDSQNIIDYNTNELKFNDAQHIKNIEYLGN